MLGRMFYLVAGAALGGYVVHKLNRTARVWSPAGIAGRVEDHVAEYRAALREFNEDIQDAMEHREAELHRRYSGGGTAPESSELPTGRAVNVIGSHGVANAHEEKDGR
ncbi:hypothetical protein FHX37_1162 [Haloactinospora alba]|uniref:Secreted protein n=1 Tax=Haloactinospora alba TaxID=405555 RepID=A0A543NHD5_9ACTN|nr:hypothetical protein [Haloactinospora alba]TQN31265.1 hypothetical protein FHX37_1162 [Haloactinospora alba]